MKEIEKIISAYEATDRKTEKAAMGTVVKVEESAYRRIGARMYVSSVGHWTGGISGGCLERDALKRAQIAINKNENSIVVYDTLDDDSHQIGVGLGCNGRIEVMFAPIDPEDENNPIEILKSIRNTRQTEVLLQILSCNDLDKRIPGILFPLSKKDLLSSRTDLALSEIDRCIEIALEERKSKVVKLQNAAGVDYEILIELIRPRVKVICIGDNYDINAFVSIADEMGWEIHVAGKLSKLSKEVFKYSQSVCSYEEATKIGVDEYTAVVLMSHDYKTDFRLLQQFLKEEIPYIGLLGPKKRMLKMQKELAEHGSSIDLGALPNLFAPVGFDIGAESPEEIALSIVSEIIATLRDRDGTRLRERVGPIHERE